MGLIPKIEAAMRLGISIELLDYFTKYCPKSGQDVKLQAIKTDIGDMFDENKLTEYRNYLNKPWPFTDKATRPAIPEAIKNDVKQEAHYSCAICGHMDNGEVAHIEPVSSSLNNSPDNLIYLCPNHHTKYDYGYTVKSNVTLDEVKAAKLIKRNARCRILKYEANATKYLHTIINFLKNIHDKLIGEENANLILIYMTEMQKLTELIPDLAKQSYEQATKDEFYTQTDLALSKHAPELSKFAASVDVNNGIENLVEAVSDIISLASDIIIDLDEVDCPHCGGSGQTGLVGDICAYCHGSCVVSQEEYEAYDKDDIDEVDCPHCNGSGQTGRVSDICAYCHGSCVVSQEEYEAYDRAEIDEVDCPHCGGSGQTGRVSDICAYCHGSCVVSQEEYEAYDRAEIDEVDCPHCGGSGQTGRVSDICAYCHGSCVVSQEEYEAYDRADIDEVDCPHCGGSGQTGRVSDICAYCHGSCVVSHEEYKAYDRDDLNEVDCPHCGGSGQTGRVGEICSLCKGSCIVTNEIRDAYWKKYGRRY